MLARVVCLAVAASATFDTNFASSIVMKRLEYELDRASEMSNTIARGAFSGTTLINASGGYAVDPERMRAHMWPLFYTANMRPTTNPLTYVFAGFEDGTYLQYRSQYNITDACQTHPNDACDEAGIEPDAYVSINGTRVQYASEGVLIDYAEATPGSCPPFPYGYNCSADPDAFSYANGTTVKNCQRWFGVDYATGEPVDEEWVWECYDPTFRSWYKLGLSARRWTNPYQYFSGEVGFDLVQPMLAPDGEVIGTCGVSFVLSKLDEFLVELMKDDYLDRTIMVLDQDTGNLLANSRVATKLEAHAETDTNDPILTVVSQYYAKGENSYAENYRDKCDGSLHTISSYRTFWTNCVSFKTTEGISWFIIVAEPAHCPPGKYFTISGGTDHSTCELCPAAASCDPPNATGLYEGLPRVKRRSAGATNGLWFDPPKWDDYKGFNGVSIKPCPDATCRGKEELEIFGLDSSDSSHRALFGIDLDVTGPGFTVSGLDCFSSDRILEHCIQYPRDFHSPFGCGEGVIESSPLCGVCESGRYLDRQQGKCLKCSPLTQMNGLREGLIVAAVVGFFVYVWVIGRQGHRLIKMINHQDSAADTDKSHRALKLQIEAGAAFPAELDLDRTQRDARLAAILGHLVGGAAAAERDSAQHQNSASEYEIDTGDATSTGSAPGHTVIPRAAQETLAADADGADAAEAQDTDQPLPDGADAADQAKPRPTMWARFIDELLNLYAGVSNDPLTLGRFKIFFSTVQVLGQVSTTNGQWPQPFQFLINIFAFFSFTFLETLGFSVKSCWRLTLRTEILGMTIFPLAIVAPFWALWAWPDTQRARDKKYLNALTVTIWVLYVFVPPTINTLLKWFVYTKLEDGRVFLASDLSLRGYDSDDYWMMAVYVIANLLVYLVGALWLFIKQLRDVSHLAEGGRKALSAHVPKAKAIKGLYLPFKTSVPHIYGEVVDLGRRLVFASLVLINTSDVTRTHVRRSCCGTAWALVWALAFREYYPFAHSDNNHLQQAAHWAIFCTYLLSALIAVFETNETNDPVRWFIYGIVLFIGNVGISLLVPLAAYYDSLVKKRCDVQAAVRSAAMVVEDANASNSKQLPAALSKVGDRMLQLQDRDVVMKLEERSDGWIFGARMPNARMKHFKKHSKLDFRVIPHAPAPDDESRPLSSRNISSFRDMEHDGFGWYYEEAAHPILPNTVTLTILIDALGGIFRAQDELEDIKEMGLGQRERLREPFVTKAMAQLESSDAQESEGALNELLQVVPLFKSNSQADEMIEVITQRTQSLVDHEATLRELAGRLKEAQNEAQSSFQRAWEKICESAADVHRLLRTADLYASKFAKKPSTSLTTLSKVVSASSSAAPQMLRAMQQIVENAKGDFSLPPPVGIVRKGSTLSDEKLTSCLKGVDRIQDKVESDYGGDYSRICDVVRASGIFRTSRQFAEALRQLRKDPKLQIVRCKDRLNHPVDGYRDVLLNVQLSGQSDERIVGELQFHFKAIIDIKSTAHVSYAMKRGLSFRLMRVASPSPAASPVPADRHVDRQRQSV